MRLHTAKFKNFKLLKDVQVDFGLDPEKPLTVVRAENASGKTSLLNGLRWGLFGMSGLDRDDVRLSPADWADKSPCGVEVEIEFEHTEFVLVGKESVPKQRRYRLVRRVSETPTGNTFKRDPERLSLYELTTKGAEPTKSPEAVVGRMLPVEMKDVFFTDGDAALSFISSTNTRGARRQQVKEAIRSLLGVALLEKACEHVKAAHGDFRARVAATAGSAELEQVEKQLEAEQGKQVALKKNVADIQARVKNLERQYEDADKELDRALQEGNQEELTRRRDKAKKQKESAEKLENQLKKDHQRLFEAESLSWALLRPQLQKATAQLDSLHDRGVIPRTTIPVLRDRLAIGVCICGAPLGPGTTGRAEVEALIASQKAADDERQRLTRIYHEVTSGSSEAAANPGVWLGELDAVEKNRLEMMKLQREAQTEMDWCEAQIRSIDRAAVEQKRSVRETVRANLSRQQQQLTEAQIRLNQSTALAKDLEGRFSDLVARSKQDASARARLDAASDTLEVLTGTLAMLQGDCVTRVSKRMNQLFLEMIGADPEQGGLFKEARITPEYDIAVLTKDGRTLDPEAELNGASKRALTFSFVWALTEVSGVVAPRIIDTPLGMMSGAVKTRVLELVAQPVSGEVDRQVALLLTRSEISGTQSVLDRYSGQCTTLTNTIHFPKDLLNEPPTREPCVLICKCDHRSVCNTCARRDDESHGLNA